MAKKILVVDDEPGAVEMLKIRLETNGYTVISAESGEECVEKAAGENPDLILLDVLLPGAGGFLTCERLKKNAKTKNIPVIMVTALFGDSVKEKGLEVGAQYIISKPYDSADLLWEIEDVLKKNVPKKT